MAQDVLTLRLKMRKSWWFWPVSAAALVFPRLWPLALSGIRFESA